MNNNHLNDIIEEGRRLVKENSNHHLPLSFRNNLLKKINDERVIGRISILCALKVYSLWNSFIPNDVDILILLHKAEKYLYDQKDENILLAMASRMQTYVTNRNDEEHFSAIYAGYSAVNAAYEVTGKDINEMNLDDFEVDSYDWDSAFYACLAYNGDVSSLEKIKPLRTKEFWEWYLNEGIKKALTKEQLVFLKESKKEQDTEFIRLSKGKVLNNQIITEKFNIIQELLLKSMPTHDWNEIYLTAYVVNYTQMSIIHYYNGVEKVKIDPIYDIRHKISNLTVSIKNDVYKLAGGEGTFYSLQLIIKKSEDKKIRFIYDIRDEELKKFVDDSDFVEDFLKYPRKKEYTPDWLQKILKKEKVDINSFEWD